MRYQNIIDIAWRILTMKSLPKAEVIITYNEEEDRYEIHCQYYISQTNTFFTRYHCIRTTQKIDDIAIIKEISLVVAQMYKAIHQSVKYYAKNVRKDIYETNYPHSGNIIPNV